MRPEFQRPLGRLVPDSQLSRQLLLGEISDSALVTVGDATLERVAGFGLTPSLQIIDGKERRTARRMPESPVPVTVIRCDNPPGGISPACTDAIKGALGSDSPVRMEVRGEEDLLVLPVCALAPAGTVVLYGQPGEGMVIVHVNDEVKNKTKLLLESMI